MKRFAMRRARDRKRPVDPAIVLVSTVVLVSIGIRLQPPPKDQLIEIRRTVVSYSFVSAEEQRDEARRDGAYRSTTILRLQDPQTGLADHEFPQVWTDALNEQRAHELFDVLPVQVRVFVDPENRFAFYHVPGAVRAYGLQVDGRDIQTVESARRSDRGSIIVTLALMQIVIVALVWQKRRNDARDEVDC